MSNRRAYKPVSQQVQLPPPSTARLNASIQESPIDLDDFVDRPKDDKETVLYLAYGSNLSNETFRGKRGIKPIAQINVQVPGLRVTFDLPGIPYKEPCFANSGRRDPEDDDASQTGPVRADSEKTPLLSSSAEKGGYRKDLWRKGLIGVVYEVSAKDYAHIIQTEGGGASYQDILIDCHPFASSDPAEPIPQNPTQPPFKAHTLFAPALPPGEAPPEDGGRVKRPDASYAQASARYLKLMKDGAAELGLPYEYQDHLQSLRSYQTTTWRQRLGQAAVLTFWLPIVFSLFGLGKMVADKRGRTPKWFRQMLGGVFKAVWISYDNILKPIFGDGERTLTDEESENVRENVVSHARPRNHAAKGYLTSPELEKTAHQMV